MPNASKYGSKGNMKTNTAIAIRLTACLLAAIPCIAISGEQSQFYLKADIGGAFAKDVKLREFFGPVVAGSKLTFDPGIRLGIRGGYDLADYFSMEVETGVTANRIDTATGATELDASLAKVPLLLNATFHLPKSTRVSPYIGGGVGMATTVLSANDMVIGGTRLDGSTAGVAFAYQGFAGVRFSINNRMAINLGYQYFGAGPTSMRTDASFGTPTDRLRIGRSETHSVSLAFVWDF